MGTSADRPYLDVIYKLCEIMMPDGSFSPIMKLSRDKTTLPGRKQVYRLKNEDDTFRKDVIALDYESVEGEQLLFQVMEEGKLTIDLPSIEQIRAVASKNISKLPEEYKKLINAPNYPVESSQGLQKLAETLKAYLTINEINGEIS